jgi:radical SAM/Cys-rich protein
MVSALPNATTIAFADRLQRPLTKQAIHTLQIDLGKRCNLACTHCHVEAGPNRTEELSPEVCEDLIQLIAQFPQIQTVDLTGGAPEMNAGFRPLVAAARSHGKTILVRTNLTIFFVDGYQDLPEYFAQNQVQVIASLPCYLRDNVDRMRGSGVFDQSIAALQRLNQRGYGHDPQLTLNLVYNPQLPSSGDRFSLPPAQANLEQAYKTHLRDQFGIAFNHLLTIANVPIGRTGQFLQRQNLYGSYVKFLADNYNAATVDALMCRTELSVDYRGYIYDCDFNQMADLPARDRTGATLTVARLLELGSLDVIDRVQTANYCYACTAGCGSSCGGALI